MRPGPSDPDLETPLLHKLQGWGVVLVLFFVIWVPAVWLLEPGATSTRRSSSRRTRSPRRHAVELFTEENQAGVGACSATGRAQGSTIPNTGSEDPSDAIPTPDLTTVCGGPYAGHPLIYGCATSRPRSSRDAGRCPRGASGTRVRSAISRSTTSSTTSSASRTRSSCRSSRTCARTPRRGAAVEEFLDGDPTNKPSPTDNVQF